MPKDPSTPPRSPKRKRSDGEHTTTEPFDEDSPVTNSPRMQVAERLSTLDIRTQRPDTLFNHRTSTPNKRLKRQRAIAKAEASHQNGALTTGCVSKYDVQHPLESCSEIGETPDSRRPALGSPNRSPTVQIPRMQQHASFDSVEASSDSKLPSSPYSASSDSIVVARLDSSERSLSPLPHRDDLSSDEAALTWQEDEITGHEIDSALGDDGEGINGIGFRPTPAIAYARKQRRKQQVNEWKAREAREARQKRFERRRGAHIEPPSSDIDDEVSEAKRLVRFVGVG